MANYNLMTGLLVLLSVVAAVLMTPYVDFYSRFDISDILSLRIFNTEKMEQENAEEVLDIETEPMRPEGWVGYPIVSVIYSGGSEFAPGVH